MVGPCFCEQPQETALLAMETKHATERQVREVKLFEEQHLEKLVSRISEDLI